MANELIHKSQGTTLTQAEYENVDAHVLNSQATGDIVYASSASQLSRLAVGSTGQLLNIASGIPAWTSLAYWPKQATGITVQTILCSFYSTYGDVEVDTLRAAPIWLPYPCTLDRIGINVTGASGAGGVARVGLYTDTGNYQPSALIVDGGAVALTGVAVVLATISQAITAGGTYWLVINVGVDGTSDMDFMHGNYGLYLQTNRATGTHGWTVATAYGALPASWPGGSARSYNIPIPNYRIASYP